MYIINSFQYWKKNKIKYASIVFTVILGIASVLASTYIVRSQKITDLEQTLNNGGFYDFAIYDIDKQVKEEIKKDTRMEHTGSLYELGSIENRNGVSCTVGAMEDESTEELVHLSTIEGRYPEKEGEIAVDRISLQCMGVQPKLGIELKVTKKDLDGNEIGEENYVVVGIIEQKYMAENGLIYTRRNYTWDSDDEGYIKIDCPCAYVSIKEKEGYGEKIREHLFANVKVSDEYDDNTIRQELLSQYGSSIRFDYNHFVRSHYADALLGYTAEEDGSLDTASGYNTALERIGSSSTEKDFVSKYVIPIFAILIAVIVFISLYEAFGNFFFSRKREMGIYRCVGMNKLQMVGLLCAELSVVIFPGIIGGVLFGNIAYQGIIQGIKKVFGIRIISAFCVNDYFVPFIDAATPDPYKYSIGLVGLALLLVCIIQIFKSWKLTPLEACNHRRLINKERKKYESLFAINVVILTVAITLGFLYFSTETRYENGLLEEEAKNCLYNGADYMMEKNTEYNFKSTGRELRHDAGVSVENYKKLQNDPSVEETFAAIQCKGIHLVSDKENRKDKFAEFLEEDCIRLEWQEDDPGYDKLKLRYERDRKKAGYTSKEELYHLPICATSQKELENIVETQMDGTLDMAQIKEGKEVVVVYSEGKPPVKVGDLLNMGEVVYPSEQDSSAGFFATGIVENKEPDFIDDYGEQYCVGRRKDFQVKVGAVIHIQDENLWNFYMVENVSKVNLLTGASGSGKSTLLHMLGGIDTPTDGKILYGMKDITKLLDKKLAEFRRKRIGFVFQSFQLLPELTVEKNVLLPWKLQHRKPNKEEIDTILEELGIKDKKNFYPEQLSGGQQQRVAIARALTHRPDLLLCDEPTGSVELVQHYTKEIPVIL